MNRVRARRTQVRLHQVLEIFKRVESATGFPLVNCAWFRARSHLETW